MATRSNLPENIAPSIECGELLSVESVVQNRWPPTFSQTVYLLDTDATLPPAAIPELRGEGGVGEEGLEAVATRVLGAAALLLLAAATLLLVLALRAAGVLPVAEWSWALPPTPSASSCDSSCRCEWSCTSSFWMEAANSVNRASLASPEGCSSSCENTPVQKRQNTTMGKREEPHQLRTAFRHALVCVHGGPTQGASRTEKKNRCPEPDSPSRAAQCILVD